MSYRCEECGELNDGPPCSIGKYPGRDGEVRLYFCEECTRHER